MAVGGRLWVMFGDAVVASEGLIIVFFAATAVLGVVYGGYLLWRGICKDGWRPWQRFADVVASVVSLLYGVGVFYLFFAPVGHRGESATRSTCLSNMNQLSKAILMYSGDFDDKMPPVAYWCDAVVEYVANYSVYVCPSSEAAKGRAGDGSLPAPDRPGLLPKTATYWMNEAFRNLPVFEDLESAGATRMFLFDAPVGKNRTGSAKDLQFRHNDFTIVTFGDLHSKAVKREDAALLDWSIPPKRK